MSRVNTMTLNPLANTNKKRIVDLAAKNRLPAIYARGDFVNAVGLMSSDRALQPTGRNAVR